MFYARSVVLQWAGLVFCFVPTVHGTCVCQGHLTYHMPFLTVHLQCMETVYVSAIPLQAGHFSPSRLQCSLTLQYSAWKLCMSAPSHITHGIFDCAIQHILKVLQCIDALHVSAIPHHMCHFISHVPFHITFHITCASSQHMCHSTSHVPFHITCAIFAGGKAGWNPAFAKLLGPQTKKQKLDSPAAASLPLNGQMQTPFWFLVCCSKQELLFPADALYTAQC